MEEQETPSLSFAGNFKCLHSVSRGKCSVIPQLHFQQMGLPPMFTILHISKNCIKQCLKRLHGSQTDRCIKSFITHVLINQYNDNIL